MLVNLKAGPQIWPAPTTHDGASVSGYHTYSNPPSLEFKLRFEAVLLYREILLIPSLTPLGGSIL